jgi:hypothetical protein
MEDAWDELTGCFATTHQPSPLVPLDLKSSSEYAVLDEYHEC